MRINRSGAIKMRESWRVLVLVFSVGAVGFLAGCGSNLSSKAGAISVTDPTGAVSGQLTSLATGAKADLTMTPINDSLNAGVDWSVTCDGSPVTGSTTNGACGTISPTHTTAGAVALYTAPTSIPIDNTVTIRSSPTSNPSAKSTATLTIATPAISIAFSGTPVSSLFINGTTDFGVRLTNDTTAAGAKWSVTCGSTDCGSFSATTTASGTTTTYTAPASIPTGNTVAITATSVADTSKSVSATVTIEAVKTISISLLPTTFEIGKGSTETANLIATVTNDDSGEGVDWAVSCSSSSCGRISSTNTASGAVATYIAPSSVPGGGSSGAVTITATAKATESNSQPATATATATITTASTIVVSVSSITLDRDRRRNLFAHSGCVEGLDELGGFLVGKLRKHGCLRLSLQRKRQRFNLHRNVYGSVFGSYRKPGDGNAPRRWPPRLPAIPAWRR